MAAVLFRRSLLAEGEVVGVGCWGSLLGRVVGLSGYFFNEKFNLLPKNGILFKDKRERRFAFLIDDYKERL